MKKYFVVDVVFLFIIQKKVVISVLLILGVGMVYVFIPWLENGKVIRQDEVSPAVATWDAPVNHHVVQEDHSREKKNDDSDDGVEGDVETIEIMDQRSPVKAKPDDWSDIRQE